ncbi:ABC-type Fe3+-siderophore transport system, permease component [Congregibacter litoralis KT71]|uniref:ABC-type Fe3+-siderophore transport system, permease component n=1 Tax=Congregibacter litoralis KT71 TaxID=314285 RepID=A4A519_9GAMM|nr:ABC-type Fe3+-siderophore transport system, permease component [Congregibacter litoralis KT71]
MTVNRSTVRRLAPHTTAICLLAALLVAGGLSLTSGAVSLPFGAALLALPDVVFGLGMSSLEGYEKAVMLELRLPRSLLAVVVGGLLAQCGAVMQGLFRNPLADPGVIGVSAGAALGATLAIFFLPNAQQSIVLPLAAFAGGFVTSMLVYSLALDARGTSVVLLLLAGVAISALSGGAIALLSYLSDDERLRDIAFWQMGSLARADDVLLGVLALAAVAVALRFQGRARALNALLLGESEARHLGIPVEWLKLELIVLVALGVGLAVSACGLIGFVGLVVPHMLRMLCGPDYRVLLPLSALGGALLLIAADSASRVVIAPAELPVGIVTALIGAPFFMMLLLQMRGRGL